MKRDQPFDHAESQLEESLAEKVVAAIELLSAVSRDYPPAAFANSLGAEDMVLTDLIAKYAPGIEIFTLDTGRLHAETHRLLCEITDHYDLRIRVLHPDASAAERLIAEHGVNGFYRSVDSRKACCQVRKVEPLRRALASKRAWVTGLRRAQAVTRSDLPVQEYDASNGLEKFNPLADWEEHEVWTYLHAFRVPYNALHDSGFPSIGCEPCTRAVEPGQDLRAGRWWWEDPASKECGLHPGGRCAAKS
jgi:phosphoadenosine phosphosulfate reductase